MITYSRVCGWRRRWQNHNITNLFDVTTPCTLTLYPLFVYILNHSKGLLKQLTLHQHQILSFAYCMQLKVIFLHRNVCFKISQYFETNWWRSNPLDVDVWLSIDVQTNRFSHIFSEHEFCHCIIYLMQVYTYIFMCINLHHWHHALLILKSLIFSYISLLGFGIKITLVLFISF